MRGQAYVEFALYTALYIIAGVGLLAIVWLSVSDIVTAQANLSGQLVPCLNLTNCP
jgi:hypothetical protein